jgi:hypothetical protein
MKFQKFLLLEAGGAKAGKLEIVNTSLEEAREWTEKMFNKKDESLYEEIPDFDRQYGYAQKMASLGHTKRKDMPVISDADVDNLLKKLSNGDIDVSAPYSPDTDQANLFPEFLKGKAAKNWLEDGKPKNDGGDKKDDVVKAKMTKVDIGDLKPIQKQIYYDKSMTQITTNGVDNSRKFLSKSTFVVSSDLHIIDGHHRWLSALLLDPKLKVNVLMIDLPIHQLLDLSKAFGDAIGNKRNA